MSNVTLQLQRVGGSGSVMAGDAVVFNSVISGSGNIEYDNSTGVITFDEAGRYVINWQVATQASTSENGAVFALSSSKGDYLVSSSPAKTGEVTGIGIIDIRFAPVTVSLINISTDTFYYYSQAPVTASLIVVQDDIVDDDPTLIEGNLLVGSETVIANGADVRFNNIRIQAGGVFYNQGAGIFIISSLDSTGYYLVNWWVATDGAGASPTITFAIRFNGAAIDNTSTPVLTGQISGTALIRVSAIPTTLSLSNITGDNVFLANTPTQAGITIARLGPI